MDSIVVCRQKNCSSSFEGTTFGFTSTINLPKEDFVFYSVPADKGFTAYIDDTETTIYKVNLGLSAVKVPKGLHEIKFTFIPRGLKEGLIITSIMLLVFLTMFYYERKI